MLVCMELLLLLLGPSAPLRSTLAVVNLMAHLNVVTVYACRDPALAQSLNNY